MRVLLTGGAGFIGQHVLAALQAGGHEVRVLDSLRPDVHRRGRPTLPAELIVGDVRDRAAVGVAWLLARRALARDRPVWTVALWAWCPVTVLELGNGAQIDWLAVLLCVLALGAAPRRPGLAGALTGAAIAVKVYPLLVLPSLLRRRPALVLGVAAGVIALSYLPHVAAVGSQVLGFLPGYLDEQRDSRNLLLRLTLPDPAANAVGLLALAAVAVWALRRTEPDAPERTAVVMVGAGLLVATPVFGWYALLLLALVALTGAIEWVPIVVAPTILYLVQGDFGDSAGLGQLLYGCAAVLGGAVFLVRRHLDRAPPVARTVERVRVRQLNRQPPGAAARSVRAPTARWSPCQLRDPRRA